MVLTSETYTVHKIKPSRGDGGGGMLTLARVPIMKSHSHEP